MADPDDSEPDGALHADLEDETGSLVDQVRDLADDVRTAVEAELAWQSARASVVGRRLVGIAVWAAIGGTCIFIAVLALAFGAILALTPAIGATLATLAVTGALLLVALIAGLMARSRAARLKKAAFSAKPGAKP